MSPEYIYKPPHGSYSRYQKHDCRCFPCRRAGSKYRSQWYQDNKRGARRIVDATPARRHYQKWQKATGLGQTKFSRLSGVPRRTVTSVVSHGQERIQASTLDAFLAVPIKNAVVPDSNEVAALPYRRRVEALAAIGYSLTYQSERMGFHGSNLRSSIQRNHIHRDTADRITRLYDELHMHPRSGTHSAEQARRYAQRQGWEPPLAWENIDDPSERPRVSTTKKRSHEIDEAVVVRVLAGERLKTTYAERREIVRRARARGWSETRIEQTTGITRATDTTRFGDAA